jgi:uncharacterized protein YggU (UPF0235/DUF167 family)
MLIKAKVKTGAKNDEIRQISPTHFEISVREKPENNLANQRVIALLAKHLHLPAAKVRIVKGHHRPSKILSLDTGGYMSILE